MSSPSSSVKSGVHKFDRHSAPSVAPICPICDYSTISESREPGRALAAKVICESRDSVLGTTQQRACGNHEYILKCQRGYTMRRTAILLAGFAILLAVGATAQENGSEISLQGTGF